MDRAEFMSRLTAVLNDVPPTEREEAIQYYNDYFDDAGEENEASVIAALGTPEELAKVIKAGLNDGGNAGEFTETGFAGYENVHKDELVKRQVNAGPNRDGAQGEAKNSDKDWRSGTHGGAGNSDKGWQESARGGVENDDINWHNIPQNQKKEREKGMPGGLIALIIIAVVLGSPIWLGVLSGLFGGTLGIFGGLLGILVAFLVVGVVMAAVGIALIAAGIAALVVTPLGGLCMIGGGLIVIAIGLVFIWLMVLVVGRVIPVLIRGIVSVCQKLFHRGGAKA